MLYKAKDVNVEYENGIPSIGLLSIVVDPKTKEFVVEVDVDTRDDEPDYIIDALKNTLAGLTHEVLFNAEYIIDTGSVYRDGLSVE